MVRRTTLALVLAALAGGCGTVYNVKQPTHPPTGNPDGSVCRVYGGVRSDFDAMTQLSWKNAKSPLDYVVIPLMCAVDLAFTFAGDTVTLPYTIGSEIARAVGSPRPEPALPATPAPGATAPQAEPAPNP